MTMSLALRSLSLNIAAIYLARELHESTVIAFQLKPANWDDVLPGLRHVAVELAAQMLDQWRAELTQKESE